MPDLFFEALNFSELSWILGVAFLSGLVRGFTGFGTALVYIPLVTQVLSPIEAVFSMIIFDFFMTIFLIYLIVLVSFVD